MVPPSGKSEYLGQVSVSVRLVANEERAETPVDSGQSQAQSAAVKGLEMAATAARKLKPGTWSSTVNIALVEGKDLLAMDEEGTSDPYCKFR